MGQRSHAAKEGVVIKEQSFLGHHFIEWKACAGDTFGKITHLYLRYVKVSLTVWMLRVKWPDTNDTMSMHHKPSVDIHGCLYNR